MDTRWPEYHALGPRNLRDARLYATADMIGALPIRRGGKVAEIGVWQGTWSKVLIQELRPSGFFAFDIFQSHLEREWNGKDGNALFDGLTHRRFYEREMAPWRGTMTIIEGPSQQTLRNYTDRSFDLVYVDGDHHYEAVKVDAELATGMTADSGFLVFNDYMMLDANNAAYGIVPVVNTLATVGGWRIVGFALNHAMHCDIALQRDR